MNKFAQLWPDSLGTEARASSRLLSPPPAFSRLLSPFSLSSSLSFSCLSLAFSRLPLPQEPLRDLGYAPQMDLAGTVASVLAAHEGRNQKTAAAFKALDVDGNARLSRVEIEAHVRTYLVRGRVDYAHTGQDAVKELVDELMEQLADRQDGFVSWWSFSEFNRRSSLDEEVWKQMHKVADELRKQIRELGHVPRV